MVSVILPVYNGEKYLKTAIDSVINQTLEDWELIIVNDGSEDTSGEIAEEYEKQDSRIKLINQNNLKLPAALNTGFNAASGEFYTWISDDNILLPECLFILRENLISDPKADMVFGNIYPIDEKGIKIKGHCWFELPPGSGNVCFPSSTAMYNIVPNNTIGPAFMYRASAAKILGGYSENFFLLEDYDYFMRMNSLFAIRHIAETKPIYAYRFHGLSLTAKDKELGITASRPKLMKLDKKRRKLYRKKFAIPKGLALDGNDLYENGKYLCSAKNKAAAKKMLRLRAASLITEDL